MEGTLDSTETVDGQLGSDDGSELSYSSRPNRYHGPATTYLSFIEEEKALTSSLLKERGQDLAIHLYNTHALKCSKHDPGKAAKLKPWAAKDRWRRKLDTEGPNNNNWAPPKVWTAWPLNPEEVPTLEEEEYEDDGLEELTLKREENVLPSSYLETVLTATTLRIAKEQFEARETEDGQQDWEGQDEVVGSQYDGHVNNRRDSSRADSVQSEDQGFAYDKSAMDIGEDSDESATRTEDNQIQSISVKPRRGAEGAEQAGESSRMATTFQPEHDLVPAISADDEQSAQILRPSVRHVLSRLDDVLMALHYARQTCFRVDSDAESDADHPSGDEDLGEEHGRPLSTKLSPSPSKRPVGRPLKAFDPSNAPLAHNPKISSIPVAEVDDDVNPKRKRGRPRTIHKPLPGETHHQMLVRIARLQKKSLPFTSDFVPPTNGLGDPALPHSKNRLYLTRRRKLGLRDWSDIMGTAALVGMPPEVIARATQRCANLFGEGMDMHIIDNTTNFSDMAKDRMNYGPEEVVSYVPEQIPELGSSDPESSDLEINLANAKQKTLRKAQTSRRKSVSRSVSRRTSPGLSSDSDSVNDVKTSPRRPRNKEVRFFCHEADCPRHEQGFHRRDHLRSHLRHAHGLEPEETVVALKGSGDEVEAGVHVDGFLRPIKAKTGWRGKNREDRAGGSKGKRRLARSGSHGEEMSVDDMSDPYESADEGLEND